MEPVEYLTTHKFSITLQLLRYCNDTIIDTLTPEEASARKQLIALCQEIAADFGADTTEVSQ